MTDESRDGYSRSSCPGISDDGAMTMTEPPPIDCTSELYIEVNSKLSAMRTFLEQLRDDPQARQLLETMVDELSELVERGLQVVDASRLDDESLRQDLRRLRRAVTDLPEDQPAPTHLWKRLRTRHRNCRESFSQLIDAAFGRRRYQHATLGDSRLHRFDASA